MKKACFLMFLSLVLSGLSDNVAVAQKCLVFRYDADGNRIKKTPINNCVMNRDMMEVQDVADVDELLVFPNPNTGCFKIIIPQSIKHEQSYYKLYDLNGLLLHENRLSDNETEIDIGDRSAGVYLLKITNGDEELSKIILKQ